MNVKEIRHKAKTIGIKAGKMRKTDLVRAIQTQEGYTPCFQTEKMSCDENTCCWRSDCVH
ncbi:MAG: hypothetical protein KAJ60_05060 [Desulfobulbaceae bacterium]|nr:hypothetical protein [Desulfobulbaceae bacterium]MCK5404802.1 hypothetical protein [Desulfobulbaceae bacterium]